MSIDSNVFVQESHTDWPERSWNAEHLLVILSVREGSRCPACEMLHFVQNDKVSFRMTLEADASLLAR